MEQILILLFELAVLLQSDVWYGDRFATFINCSCHACMQPCAKDLLFWQAEADLTLVHAETRSTAHTCFSMERCVL